MDARTLWLRGEDLAAEHLRRSGYRVLERNYRARHGGEIDIVARRGRCVVFCEVKARAGDRFGRPAEAVNLRKQSRIRKVAGEWLAHRRPGWVEVRFDVVSIIVRGDRAEVTHITNAF
jgi:putative endonuclease